MKTENIGSDASRRILWLTMLAALVLVAATCSKDSSSPLSPAATELRITPADGATAVRLDAPVVLEFGLAADRPTVESGLYLMSEADMTTGPCPDTTMGPHGTMLAMMGDTTMLHHMEQFHATHGHFTWNTAGTVCTFQPDSLMRPQMRYLVIMSGTMGRMMQSMGGRMSGGSMNGWGDWMVHFQTMAPTNTRDTTDGPTASQ